jgi:hypothetical protein
MAEGRHPTTDGAGSEGPAAASLWLSHGPARRLSTTVTRHWPGLLLLLAAATLYLFTLDNGLRPGELVGGDLITHQYAQVQARPSNAPGYPLYTMGGWLWFRLGRLILGPNANPIPILSSYSTLWGLVALGLLYVLIVEATDRGDGGNRWVAFLASGFYAVTYFFWYYSVTTEEYASAVAWTLAVYWLVFRWQRARKEAYLLGIALLAGVGLAHILTVLIVIPALLWFVLSEEPRLLRRPRLIALAIGLAALPLLSYAFVYVRVAQHPEWRGSGLWSSTWQWFWSFISTQQGRSELTWSWTPFLTADFPRLIIQEMTLPILLLGLAGLAWLGRRRAALLYASLAIYLVFCWIDRQGNWFQVIIPAYALLALGLGLFADRLWRLKDRRALRAAVILVLVALIAGRGTMAYAGANERNRPEDSGLVPGWTILADNPPRDMAILGTLQEEAALNYLTQIWGIRPDIQAVSSDQARTILNSRSRPLAVTVAALPLIGTEVSPNAHYSALGRSLIGLTSAPLLPEMPTLTSDDPAGIQPWRYSFGDGLQLTGGRVDRNQATGETVVRLLWLVQEKPQIDWSVSVRLTQGGTEIGQTDQAHPVAGAYPTTRWSPGETVVDAYALRLPAAARPDGATVILYRRSAGGAFVNLGVARLSIR